MTDSIIFWLGKSVAEAAIFLAIVVIIGVVSIVIGVVAMVRQSRCRHSAVNETQACDAICRNCGKNLGFIQIWRDKQRGAK